MEGCKRSNLQTQGCISTELHMAGCKRSNLYIQGTSLSVLLTLYFIIMPSTAFEFADLTFCTLPYAALYFCTLVFAALTFAPSICKICAFSPLILNFDNFVTFGLPYYARIRFEV